MVTTVGHESDIKTFIQNLLYLERDALAAYDSAFEKLDNQSYRSKVAEFRGDHLTHISTLENMAGELGVEAPTDGDMKHMLTTGKVALANLLGDSAILKAMRSNEEDTVTAYERAAEHLEALPATTAFFRKALGDEQRHRAWFADSAASA